MVRRMSLWHINSWAIRGATPPLLSSVANVWRWQLNYPLIFRRHLPRPGLGLQSFRCATFGLPRRLWPVGSIPSP